MSGSVGGFTSDVHVHAPVYSWTLYLYESTIVYDELFDITAAEPFVSRGAQFDCMKISLTLDDASTGMGSHVTSCLHVPAWFFHFALLLFSLLMLMLNAMMLFS